MNERIICWLILDPGLQACNPARASSYHIGLDWVRYTGGSRRARGSAKLFALADRP